MFATFLWNGQFIWRCPLEKEGVFKEDLISTVCPEMNFTTLPAYRWPRLSLLSAVWACLWLSYQVEKGSILAAGATLPPKKVVPSGQIWAGNPAKFLRDLEEGEADYILQSASDYTALAAIHAAENGKTFMEVEVIIYFPSGQPVSAFWHLIENIMYHIYLLADSWISWTCSLTKRGEQTAISEIQTTIRIWELSAIL